MFYLKPPRHISTLPIASVWTSTMTSGFLPEAPTVKLRRRPGPTRRLRRAPLSLRSMIRPWSWWPVGVVPDTVVSPIGLRHILFAHGASCPMQDLQAKLEKLLMEAEDCALIAKVAPNQRKRELFER